MLSSRMGSFVKIGVFGRTHGVKGWISVYSASDMNAYDPWYIKTERGWQPLDIDDKRTFHNKMVIHIRGIDSPEEVRGYRGKDIAVLRSQFPPLPEGEYYWADLERFSVIDKEGKDLGEIDSFMRTANQDIMVVVKGKQRYLIPFIKNQIILNIDPQSSVITVDWNVDF